MREKNRKKKLNTVLALFLAAIFGMTSFAPAVTSYAAGETETAAVEEPAKEQEEEAQPYNQSVTVKDLKVTAKADAGVLPNGSELRVEPITKGDDYKDIEKKVRKDAEDDDRELSGFLAYDISFEVDGQETEPNGKVNVTMEWDKAALPDDVEKGAEVSVLHLTDDDEVVDLTESEDKDNTAEVKTKSTDEREAVEKAEIRVQGFSVFTITWTKSADDDTRIGAVEVRYVDSTGLEIDTASDFAETELASMSQTNGGVVDLSSWANKNGSSRVDGYTYDHAAIGSRDGTTITGVKVAQDTETRQVVSDYNEQTGTYIYQDVQVTIYRLYYTTDKTVSADSKWTLYKDSGSDDYANSANIFLFYKSAMGAPLTFHYLTLYGNPIKDGDGNELTKTIDAATLTNPTAVDEWANTSGNLPNGYSLKNVNGYNNNNPYTNSRFTTKIETGNISSGNTYLRSIKYAKEDGDDKYYIYAGRGTGTSATWTTPGKLTGDNPDIYITLQPATNLSVTIHRVDENGQSVGTDVTKTVSNDQAVSLTDADIALDGYSTSSGYYDWTDKDNKGISFATMTYSQAKENSTDSGNTIWKSSYKANASDETSTDTTNLETELWVVYTASDSMNLTVHHMNALGTEIAAATTQKVSSGNTITAGSLTKTSGYTTGYDYSVYYINGDTKTNFTSLTYSYDSGNWSSKADSDENATDSLVKDVYLVYTPNTNAGLKIHYVDESGGVLHATATNNNGVYQGTTWDGWSLPQSTVSGIGTFQYGYLGAFGQNQIPGGSAPMYKKDSNGTWHTGIGTTQNKNDYSESNTGGVKEVKINDQSILLTDIYQVYGGSGALKGVTYHHVDASGNQIAEDTYTTVSSGNSITPKNAAVSVSGKTYTNAHIGSYNGTVVDKLTFTYDNSQSESTKKWSSTYTSDTQTTATSTGDTAVNEVWLVYGDRDATKTQLTLHYQYVNTSGSYSDAYYDNDPQNTTDTLTVNNGQRTYLVTDQNNGAYVSTIHEGNVKRPADTSAGETDAQSVVFMSSHLSGSDGPVVTSVDVDADGNMIYHTNMEGMAEPDTNSINPTSWTFSEPEGAQRGRSIKITKDSSGNLQLTDSLSGDLALYLVNDAAETGNANTRVGASYKATFHGENYTVDYVVTPSTYNRTQSDGTVVEMTRYGIEVLDSYPSTSTDIYQVYVDGTTSDDKLWIEDDMKYSGLFRTGVSDSLEAKLATATGISYEWHRVTIADSAALPAEITDVTNSNYEIVRRKQSGEHWNIALNANEATWLDVEADEGDAIWSKGTTHAYYVKLTYTEKGASEPTTIYSTPISVQYYGQLENGSFETPVMFQKSEPETVANTNGYAGTQINDFVGNQTSNENYKKNGGVWQTTGTGEGTKKSGNTTVNIQDKDIEIFNINQGNTGLANYWRNSSTGTSNKEKPETADDGVQFAELNCETAGALYQDVITHPNESINYWFSHRARIQNTASTSMQTKYDSMYLVIMPTKLAMTSGDNSTELRTQSELQKFIEEHGGYDTTQATAEESRITYRDDDAGILIRKVSSDNFDWHDISEVNNYIAKGGLTRFFFVAGATSSGDKTEGNFLDNVGFNQTLPPTRGFNLTITETFSGLTLEQLAGLASNASSFSGNGITAQKNALELTLTNTNTATGGGSANDALSGARLGLKMGYDNNGNLVLTPTATSADGKTDLLSSSAEKPGTSSVRQYSDGRIVISWVFPDQQLSTSTGQAMDQTYNYVVNDNKTEGSTTVSTTDISGFTKTTSQNSVDNSNSTTEITPNTAGTTHSNITKGSDKTLNIINIYSPSVHISVRKTFSGVTPTTVAEMMNGTGKSADRPYSITITKGSGADAVSKILKVDGGYSSDGTTKDTTVSVSSTQGSDGTTTYKWVITDPAWQNATYSVKEENYTTTRNTLSKVTVNTGEAGAAAQVTLGNDNSWPLTNPAVKVEDSTEAAMNFTATSSLINNGVVDLSSQGGTLSDTAVSSSTNLIVGQYTLETTDVSGSSGGSSGGSGGTVTRTKKYIVWTSTDVGLITRRAIIKQINNIWGETDNDKATLSNTSFFTGDNAYIVTDGRIARMVDHQSASLTGQAWDKFYAAGMTAKSNTSFEDESEIRIENEYTPKVKIQKQSSKTTTDAGGNATQERLNGAQFRLYKTSTSGQSTTKLYLQNTDSTSESELWKTDTDKAKIFTTAKDSSEDNLGDGIALLTSLPTDSSTTYYLEEYKAPDGYNKIGDIAFKVRTNGTVTLVDSNGTDRMADADEGVEVRFIDPYYTFIIDDDPGVALPETGGPGTLIFTALGLLLILTATILLGRRGYLTVHKTKN